MLHGSMDSLFRIQGGLAQYCFFGFGAAMGCGIGMDSAPPPADAAAAAGDEDGGYYSD